MREKLLEQYPGIDFLFADGLDEAIIGIDIDSFNAEARVVYSIKKCLDIFKKDMTYEEAVEHFYFNVAGAYMGEQTPIWVNEIISET